MVNNSSYNMMINNDKDTIFIQLKDEKYKEVIAKVSHIEWNENNELEFELELPKGKESYYNDEVFCNNVQQAVGDIVAKSVNTYWNEAEKAILTDLEEKINKVMAKYDIKLPEGKSYIDAFAEKGYVISEDDDNKLVAIKPTTEEIYHFDNQMDLSFLRQEITGSKLIL
jgi:hypothetical protein